MRATALMLAAVALAGCGHKAEQAARAKEAPPVTVSTVAAAQTPWPVDYEATGTVQARVSTAVAAKMMGYIKEVRAAAGDRVAEGDLLAVIDARDLDTGVRKAEAMHEEIRSAIPEAENGIAASRAQLELAETTFRRMENLFQKKSVSHQEFDEASARLKAARAAHEMAMAKRRQLDARMQQAEQERRAAEIQRGFAEVRAPFAGIVVARNAEAGTLAVPGVPIVTIEAARGYRLEAQVEESRVGSIRLGQTAHVVLEALDRSLAGRVSQIVPAVDSQSRAYTVKIDLPAVSELRSGMFGRARFAAGSSMVIAIPEGALTERGQLYSVMTAEDGRARVRLITPGRRRDDRVEMLSGLQAGEQVIFPVPPGLTDGARVEVR